MICLIKTIFIMVGTRYFASATNRYISEYYHIYK